jgi:TorA maturation chaperone TorD
LKALSHRETLLMSATEIDRKFEIDRAVCRGIIYDVIALGLRPPTRESLSRIGADGASEALADAAAVIDGPDGAFSIGEELAGLLEAGRQCDLESLQRCRERLFGHTAHGKAPPYETEYGSDDPFRQAEELADLTGFYRAFGLELREEGHERCDHMAAECEFLSFLTCKEAYELLEGNIESSEEVRKAERLFLRDHAGRFGRAFALTLEREADDPFYQALGRLCREFLTAECETFGVQAEAETIALRSTADDDVPMACGSCRVAELAGGDGGCAPPEE